MKGLAKGMNYKLGKLKRMKDKKGNEMREKKSLNGRCS